MIKMSKILKNSLWDYDLKKLSYDDEIVVLRALSFWEIEDIKNIESHIWREKLIKIFRKKNKWDR